MDVLIFLCAVGTITFFAILFCLITRPAKYIVVERAKRTAPPPVKVNLKLSMNPNDEYERVSVYRSEREAKRDTFDPRKRWIRIHGGEREYTRWEMTPTNSSRRTIRKNLWTDPTMVTWKGRGITDENPLGDMQLDATYWDGKGNTRRLRRHKGYVNTERDGANITYDYTSRDYAHFGR